MCGFDDSRTREYERDFNRFVDRTGPVSELKPKYDIGYMIFVLCDGDMSKAKGLGDTWSYPDALQWMSLASYRGYMQEKLSKQKR